MSNHYDPTDPHAVAALYACAEVSAENMAMDELAAAIEAGRPLNRALDVWIATFPKRPNRTAMAALVAGYRAAQATPAAQQQLTL